MSDPHLPSSVDRKLSLFDRFSSAVNRFVSKAPFFAFAVFLVVAWLIEGFILMAASGPEAFVEQKYQLQINTVTTVVTFLLVALLQNTQTRSEEAIQEKLNAIADGLGDLMEKVASDQHDNLHQDVKELRAAVGLEDVVDADDVPSGSATQEKVDRLEV